MNKKDTIPNKFLEQDQQYQFPYHYIPYYDVDNTVRIHRELSWGFEYMCYIKFIKDIALQLRPKSLLDVGCGDGRFTNMIKPHIEHLKGIDLSERAINFAKTFNPDVKYEVTDAKNLNEEFDIVSAIEVLEHVPDENISTFINSLTDRTKANGHIIISVPTKIVKLNKKHYRHYDIELIKEQIGDSKAPLKIIKQIYLNKELTLVNLYNRLTKNRLWFIEIEFLRKKLWRYMWNNSIDVDKRFAKRIVVVLQKNA